MASAFSWSDWQFSDKGCAVFIALVALGLWRSRTIAPHWLWWVNGFLVLLVLCSPLQTDSMSSYSAHMAEHLVVILILAPIAVWSWKPRGLQQSLSLLGFFGYVIVIPLYHLTSLGGLIMRSTGAQDIELFIFAAIGVAFWLGPCGSYFTRSQRTTYIALALPISIFTGVALTSLTRVPFTLEPMPGMALTLSDLHQGGQVMAVLSSCLLIAHVLWSALSSKPSMRI